MQPRKVRIFGNSAPLCENVYTIRFVLNANVQEARDEWHKADAAKAEGSTIGQLAEKQVVRVRRGHGFVRDFWKSYK